MRGCYFGSGVAAGILEHTPPGDPGATSTLVKFDEAKVIDRVVIREDVATPPNA
jgi:hypothetical protein